MYMPFLHDAASLCHATSHLQLLTALLRPPLPLPPPQCLPRADCIDGGTESRLESAMLPEVPAGVLEGSLQYAHARTCKPHLGACLPRFDGIDRLAGTVAVRAGLT